MQLIDKLKNRDFLITVATVLFSVSLQFVFIRYSSYGIEKNDFGNYVLLQTLIAALSATLLQIPSQAFDRFYNQAKDKTEFVNEFRTILMGINIVSLILIIAYGFVIKKFTTETLFILFVYFALLNNYALNQKVFLLELERSKYFYLQILEACSKFLFPIFAYILFHTMISLFLGILLGYALSYGLLLHFLKEYPYRIVMHLPNLKKYFNFAYPILFVSMFTWGISFSDRYFIDYFLSTKDVAIYSLLAMVAGIGQIVGQIYFMYVEPKILKEYEIDPIQTFRNIEKYLKNLALVFSILTLIAFIVPKEIYLLLLEKDLVYSSYYFSTMMILLIAIFLNVIHIAHHMYLKLMKRLDVLAYIFLIALIINLIGNLFIRNYGIMAAAIATLIAYLSILIMQILFVKRASRQTV